MKYKASMLFVLFVFLIGCSPDFQPDTLSIKDIAFKKVDNENEKVYYGMKREEAEKILGDGVDGLMNYTFYDNGVNVFYRDGKMVSFYLGEDSKGIYKTSRGLEIGMNKDMLSELLGEKNIYEFENGDPYYMYDIKNKEFLKLEDLKNAEREYLENIYVFSISCDTSDNLDAIMIFDRRSFIYND